LPTNGQRSKRGRMALASTGAAVASCAALATLGSGAAIAATPHQKHHGQKQTQTKKTKGATSSGKAKVTDIPWGTANGQSVDLYTLHGAGGMKVKISQFGADIQSIDVPNKNGKLTDVALGFPTLADYVADFEQGEDQVDWPIPGSTSGTGDTYFGATVGEYANRIAGGKFPLNGTTYTLDQNNGPNDLHGGYHDWSNSVWAAAPSSAKDNASVAMSATFPAGSIGCDTTLTPGCTGFPTTMNATVTFTLTKNNALKIGYSATNESSSLSTVINLTNHTYLNLGGQASGNVYNQDLAINGNDYTPTDPSQIPEPPYFIPVKGTPFNFLDGHPIGKYLYSNNLPDGTQATSSITQLQYAHGYDHNWVLNGQGKYRLDAVAEDPSTGITMWQYTDQPGVQLYTSNYVVGDLVGTTGKIYRQGQGFTLETQHYPDSPNHQGDPSWPSVVLQAGQTFTSNTAFKFGVKAPGYASSVQFK
jgi:aldose 1-epimerase